MSNKSDERDEELKDEIMADLKQEACDHYLGENNIEYEGGNLVTESYAKVNPNWKEDTELFTFCPKCGVRL